MEPHTWKVEWNEGMSVGIHEIDADHKRFILLIDDLNRAIVDRMDLEYVKKRLQLILDDAARHFAHEEKLLQEWRYPDANEHAKKHAAALKSLEAIQEQLFAYKMTSEWIDVGLKVKDILINHMLTEDSKYAEFYRNTLKARGKP